MILYAHDAQNPSFQVNSYTYYINGVGTIMMTLPSTVALGEAFTVSGQAAYFSNPVYQMWFQLPPNPTFDPNGVTTGEWYSTGAYRATNQFTLYANMSGTWNIVLYARNASDPANETGALPSTQLQESPNMRAMFEVSVSGTVTVTA